MSHLEKFGKGATLHDFYKAYRPVGRHILAMAQAAVEMTDELSIGECELIGAYVSGLNKNAYCLALHGEAAVKCGIGRKALPELGGSVPRYGEDRWRPVYAYVGALTAAPGNASQIHIDGLKDAGWSEDAIAQMAALVAVYNTFNRLADGLGVEAGPKHFRESATRTAERGYVGTSKLLRLG